MSQWENYLIHKSKKLTKNKQVHYEIKQQDKQVVNIDKIIKNIQEQNPDIDNEVIERTVEKTLGLHEVKKHKKGNIFYSFFVIIIFIGIVINFLFAVISLFTFAISLTTNNGERLNFIPFAAIPVSSFLYMIALEIIYKKSENSLFLTKVKTYINNCSFL